MMAPIQAETMVKAATEATSITMSGSTRRTLPPASRTVSTARTTPIERLATIARREESEKKIYG